MWTPIWIPIWIPGAVACNCNPATLEADFRNGEASVPVGGGGVTVLR